MTAIKCCIMFSVIEVDLSSEHNRDTIFSLRDLLPISCLFGSFMGDTYRIYGMNQPNTILNPIYLASSNFICRSASMSNLETRTTSRRYLVQISGFCQVTSVTLKDQRSYDVTMWYLKAL